MKKNLILLYLTLLTLNAYSNVLRVNNNYGIIPTYTTFTNVQQAHDAANNGDTIHVESSATSYGNMNASKQIVWIGPGYFIGEGGNNNAGLQHHIYEATLGLRCLAGSDGSTFIGLNLTVNNLFSTLGIFISANNITIQRCKTPGIRFLAQSNNFKIKESFILGSIQNYNPSDPSTGDYYISNNYIQNGIQLPANYVGVIVINNFIQETSYVVDGAFINNIIHNYSGNSILCSTPGNVMNNLFMYQTNTNYVGTHGNLFVSESPQISNSVMAGPMSTLSDNWMTLKPGSIAIGNGQGGNNIGPYGGTSPYKLSGIPIIPSIYNLQVNIEPGTNLLPCLISTRSNQ